MLFLITPIIAEEYKHEATTKSKDQEALGAYPLENVGKGQ